MIWNYEQRSDFTGDFLCCMCSRRCLSQHTRMVGDWAYQFVTVYWDMGFLGLTPSRQMPCLSSAFFLRCGQHLIPSWSSLHSMYPNTHSVLPSHHTDTVTATVRKFFSQHKIGAAYDVEWTGQRKNLCHYFQGFCSRTSEGRKVRGGPASVGSPGKER